MNQHTVSGTLYRTDAGFVTPQLYYLVELRRVAIPQLRARIIS
jgi:hypothetical protein